MLIAESHIIGGHASSAITVRASIGISTSSGTVGFIGGVQAVYALANLSTSSVSEYTGTCSLEITNNTNQQISVDGPFGAVYALGTVYKGASNSSINVGLAASASGSCSNPYGSDSYYNDASVDFFLPLGPNATFIINGSIAGHAELS